MQNTESCTDSVYKITIKHNSGNTKKVYFCPVGTAFDSDYIEIRNVFEGEVTANTLTKDEILRVANTYSNHVGEVIYRVSYHRVTEDWGD